MKIYIKPMSVNKCWRGGRRFKTKEYIAWRDEFSYLTRSLKAVFKNLHGKIGLSATFCVKNVSRSDTDNFLKPFLDACSEAGLIKNDNDVYEILVRKKKATEKEYVEFEFYQL